MVSVRRSPFPIVLFYVFILLFLAGRQTPLCLSQGTPTPSDTDTTKNAAEGQYQIEPSTVVPGGHYTFVITAPAAACKKEKAKPASDMTAEHNLPNAPAQAPKVETDSTDQAPFVGVTPQPSSSSDLTLGTLTSFTGDTCKTTLAGTVSGDANGGDLLVYLQKSVADKKEQTVASLRLKVKLEKAASPIPPGLSPEVDLMWKVLPRKTVADSYGNRVADGYFAIETVIGNNSGWDLQVAALGFDMPYYDCVKPEKKDAAIADYNFAHKQDPPPDYYVNSHYDHCHKDKNNQGRVVPRKPVSIDMPTPIDAYPVVRSTIEREQFVGRRAIFINLVKASGSTLVGIGGLLPDAGNFVKTTSIFNGPFEKGIELVYPDLTTLHLIGLDNRTLRDGTVIPNNTSVRVNVFISREIVMCSAPSRWWHFDHASKRNYSCVYNDARVPYQHDFNPADIRERLGELTVVGRKIQYLERVRVLTKTSDLPESKPGILFSNRVLTVIQDKDNQPLLFIGTNLGGTTLVSSSPEDLKITDQKVSEDGTSISFKATTKNLKPLTRVPITAASSRGFSVLYADVKANPPSFDTPTYDSATQTVTISGTYLTDATVTIHHGNQNVDHGEVSDKDGKKLTFKVKKALDPDSDYTLSVRTDGGGSDTLALHTPVK